MAGDIRKTVVSSLKCALVGTKVTGSSDIELRISVHIEEDRSPSFVDLVKQGIIQFKNFGIGVCERQVSDGCKNCGKDVLCKDRELELVFGVPDTNMVCQNCTADTASETSSKRGRKSKQKKPNLTVNEDIKVLAYDSPIVVLERIEDYDVQSDSSSVPLKQDVVTPHCQTPVKIETPSSNIRRSSRSTKSRFRRNFAAEMETEETTDEKPAVDVEDQSISLEEKCQKRENLSKSKMSHKKVCEKQENKKQERKSKRKRDDSDDWHLQLSESDGEAYVNYDDDDNDPDFVIEKEVHDDNLSENEGTADSSPDTIKSWTIKVELENTAAEDDDEEDVLDDDAEVDLNIKCEKDSVASGDNIIVEDFKIRTVTVSNRHVEEFACHVCHKSFMQKRYLLRHFHKAGKEPILCDICGAKFHYQSDVDQHMLAHNGFNEYLCGVCHKSLPDESRANKHVKIHLAPHERPHICTICGKGFVENHSLQEHAYIHAEVKPYECNQCDSKFAARYLLNAHMKYHSKKTYRCYTCSKVYKVFASLKEHLSMYKDHYTDDTPEPIEKVPYVIEKTPKKTQRKTRLSLLAQKQEARRKWEESFCEENASVGHQDAPEEEQDKADDSSVSNSVTTPSVSETFQKECLDLIECPNEADPNEGDEETSEQEDTSVKSETMKVLKHGCKICFRKYNNKASLLKHYRKLGKVCFPCRQCDAKFHRNEDRVQHKLLHTGQHPYQCKICFRSFLHLSKCKKHAATHLPTNVRPFVCEICGSRYADPNDLDRHKWNHNQTGPNKCQECNRVFRSESAFQRHMNVHKGKVYECKTCSKAYKYPSSLRDHMLKLNHISEDCEIKPKNLNPPPSKKDQKQDRICDVCGIICSSSASLGSHMRIHKTKDTDDTNVSGSEALKKFAYEKHIERIESHKAKLKSYSLKYGQFNCKQCGQVFKLRASLRRHKHQKHGELKHECHICQKKFFIPSELERHLLCHSDERPFRCHLCPSAFHHDYGLKRHLKVHLAKERLAYGCDVCGKRFTERCYLREHMRRHTGERPFVCDICNKGFVSNSILKGHKLSHLPKSHSCNECGKYFSHKSNLNSHIKGHKGLKPKQDYLCDDCGKSFHSKSGLLKHQVKHTGIKNYKCEHPGCVKAFYFKQEVKNHQRAHEDVRPFQCELCGRSFKYQTSFTSHIHYHKNLPPLECEICSKEFFVPAKLKQHMTYHLGERNIPCDECGKTFITQRDLTGHKKLHVGTFECADCHKLFNLETRLKKHHKLHEGPERVQCPRCNIYYKDVRYLQTTHLRFCDPKKICSYCGRRFGCIRKLQCHIGIHTGKRPYECDQCGTAYPKKEMLENHKERHKTMRYPCKLCDKGFDRTGDLKKHEEFHKKQDNERKKVEAYKYQLLCEQSSSKKVETTASTSYRIFLPGHIQPGADQEQKRQDILAEATASINVMDQSIEVIDNQSMHVVEGGTVVQYVQENGQVLELDTSSLIQNDTDQVILTTIDTSHLSSHDGNEILMVAMIPETQ